MKEEMPTLKIGEREIPMYLSTAEILDIQEEIGCTVGELWDQVFGYQKDFENDNIDLQIVKGNHFDAEKVKKFAKLIKILGNAGLEEKGENPDLTEKWILRHLKPTWIITYVLAVAAIINHAMALEAKQGKDGPVDEILEEENRKKEQGN